MTNKLWLSISKKKKEKMETHQNSFSSKESEILSHQKNLKVSPLIL